MNILGTIFSTFFLFGTMTAFAAPASENTLKELFAVTQVQKLVDGIQAQGQSFMDKCVEQALEGKPPTAKQRQAIDNMKNKMVRVVQRELSWERLEPSYLRLYSESFTEEEVGGMLSFYKTPVGQAVINKMPTLMQKIMAEMPRMMNQVLPDIQKIQEEFMAEVKAAGK